MFWWCAILFGINTLLFIFFYEETKYIQVAVSGEHHPPSIENDLQESKVTGETKVAVEKNNVTASDSIPRDRAMDHIDHNIPLLTYHQKLRFLTTTPSTWRDFSKHFYQPLIILCLFPAVGFTAIQFGSLGSWSSVITTSQSEYFAAPPYNFGTIGIGFLNLPPLVGSIFAAIWSGPISDLSIQFFAKRNKGVFEPEMRLYLIVLPFLCCPAGILMFGYSVAKVSITTC